MKRKVSFRMFLSVMWRGVWQAVCWVAGMFGYNDKTTYGKIVRRVFAGSVAVAAFVFAAVMAYAGYEAVREDFQRKEYCRSELTERRLSKNISFMENYYSWKNSYLFNYATGKKMYEGKIAWIVRSNDDDSLAVFSDGKKRGYINRYTGEIQIPAEYDHAWIFSDGVACVQKGNEAFFIDHNGNPICGKRFAPPSNKEEGYVFHKGYCAVAMKENGWGLIGKNGEWQLDGCGYLYIRPQGDFWIMCAQDGKEGVRTEILTIVLDMHYTDIAIDDTGIYATDNQGWRRKYGFRGEVIEDFVVKDICNLYYETDVKDNEGNLETKQALCRKYTIDEEHCGLMSADGKPLTPAIYSDIEAISIDRFVCSIAWNEKVILDELGRKVGK